MGRIGSALLCVNGMIGAGIFAMPAILFSTLGSFAPWMILIVGLLAICTSAIHGAAGKITHKGLRTLKSG